MSTTVTYKGETLTTVENQTRTLLTSGKYLEDDLTLVDISQGEPSLQAKTNITPTTSSQTITPDSGYDGLSSVQINAMPTGTAGTPTATKSTVSNHAVSVTPSVTNTTGYITGSTKTGTAVTVSASELVSGTKSITANGTGIDVTDYASVDVAVSSGATYTITVTNGASTAFTYRYVEYNNIQYTTGSFTINSGDSIRIISDGMNQGDIYYDGSKVATANYTITPACDLNIEYIYDDAYITLPTIAITQNGVYNVESYARADVNVPTGGGGFEPITVTITNTEDIPNSHFYYIDDAGVANHITTPSQFTCASKTIFTILDETPTPPFFSGYTFTGATVLYRITISGRNTKYGSVNICQAD